MHRAFSSGVRDAFRRAPTLVIEHRIASAGNRCGNAMQARQDGTMQVMVIGGGIGGLTMALSLHQAGIPVRVYESSRLVKPLGVGINLQPSAVRELDELGVAGRVAEAGNSTHALLL
jgi:hypothetical protein